MLYFLYLYDIKTGELLYDKDCCTEEKIRMDMFGSFFSAIKSLLSELTDAALNKIGLGDYIALIQRVDEINADLVVIANKEDIKKTNKLSEMILNIIKSHKEIFLNKDIHEDIIQEFDNKIINAILSNKCLIDPNLLYNTQGDILKSIWEQKGAISAQLREEQEHKRDELNALINTLENKQNLIEKANICQEIIEFSKELREEKIFIKYQKVAREFVEEIKDRIIKLEYYIDQVKNEIKSINDPYKSNMMKDKIYSELYMNLYNFATKLKNIASEDEQSHYRRLANKYFGIKRLSKDEINEANAEVANLEQNPLSYFEFALNFKIKR